MIPAQSSVHPWVWFSDKVLPPLIVAMCLSMCTAAWWISQTVNSLVNNVRDQQVQIDRIELRVSNLESNSVTRNEMLETLKRVEQQLEIVLLRSGVKAPRVSLQ